MKEKELFEELRLFGYDHNLLARPKSEGNRELESHVDEFSRKIIDLLWTYYISSDQQYEESMKRSTVMRFCLTIGIGMA